MNYLTFRDETPEGRKTSVVGVYSTLHGDLLGQIKWFGRWRQYAFFPGAGTAWNPDCLRDINGRIGALMAERRTRGAA